jgi:HSP20 family protein
MKNMVSKENKSLTNSGTENNSLTSNTEKGNKLSYSSFPGFGTSNFPSVDITENDKEVMVTADIPGMTDKDIHLTYQNGNLCLSGEKKGGYEDKSDNSYYRESWSGSFSRTIPLGSHLDWDNVSAKCNNGQLNITIPKKAGVTSNAKKIEIS